MKNIDTIASYILSILMIVFGLNKFIGFIAIEPPADPTAQSFLGAMFSSYLFVIVGLTEIIAGILMLISKTRFLAWLFLLPVMVNIIAFHLAHDFIGNGIWLAPTALFIVVGFFHKDRIVSLL